MQVVILAGGFGTRLSEETDLIPKPMVKIGDIPILHHIIDYYAKFGHREFVLALGYKAEIVEDYFKRKKILNNLLFILLTFWVLPNCSLIILLFSSTISIISISPVFLLKTISLVFPESKWFNLSL